MNELVAAATGGLVLSAEPGAGKTTRLPPALLGAITGTVLVVEPRRIAARMAAHRVASEMGEQVGETVGYAVRFDRKVGKRTRLVFMTEGLLLRRIIADPMLRDVGAIVFDELHERALQMDLGLALARELRTRRPDLCLVAMSATLDTAPVSAFLDAPAFHVEGRTFPVDVRYEDGGGELDRRVAVAVRKALDEDDGDVLVFLPGMAEIVRASRRCAELCKKRGVDLEMLHGDLPPKDQDRVVRSGPRRKVVLSTNIAESSVTLPNVTCVIDSGLVRRASQSPWTGLPALRVERISQASAIQRAGRAGRVRPGRAIRLFSEGDFRRRPAFDSPEIARLDLSTLVLLLRSLRQDPYVFPFFEAPPRPSLDAAEALLDRLGALSRGEVTDFGARMLQLPLHPRLAALALRGDERGVGARACTIAALLSEGRLARERVDRRASADVLVDLERYEEAEAERLRDGELRARGLDVRTFRNARRLSERLQRTLKARPIAQSLVDDEDDLRAAIVMGFCDRIGKRQGERAVFTTGSAELDSCTADSEFIAAVDVQDRTERGGRGRTVVRSACEVEGELLLELFEDRIEESDVVRFDASTERVRCMSGLRYDGLVLDESERHDYLDAIGDCLAEAAWDPRHRLFDVPAFDTLLSRLRAADRGGLSLELDERDTLMRRAIRLLADGHRSFADLRRGKLADGLMQLQPAGTHARLERVAPSFISLPGRKRVPVNYEEDRPPWVQSRMQDFFGMAQGPSAGSTLLVLHLLAPNRRAVQVTQDLAGFWERHYPALRKQLMRRYPKHAWPEDPVNATPPPPRKRS